MENRVCLAVSFPIFFHVIPRQVNYFLWTLWRTLRGFQTEAYYEGTEFQRAVTNFKDCHKGSQVGAPDSTYTSYSPLISSQILAIALKKDLLPN